MDFEDSSFRKVTGEERKRLLRDLSKLKIDVQCKGIPDQVFKLRLIQINGEDIMIFMLPNEGAPLLTKDEVLFHIFIGGENYYFLSTFKRLADKWSVVMPTTIFLLQRRQSYRVRIPDGYPATFEFKAPDKKELHESKSFLLDLSLGGCRLTLPHQKDIVQENEVYSGILVIPNKVGLEIDVKIKHIRLDKAPRISQTFGVEFLNLGSAMENRMFVMMMELHRMFFSKQ